MTLVTGRLLNNAYGFRLGSFSDGSLNRHCLSIQHTSYLTVHFPSPVCIIDGVGMVQPRRIIGYSLQHEVGDPLVFIF